MRTRTGPALLGSAAVLAGVGLSHADEPATVVVEDHFSTESETWVGGTVADGVLALDGDSASVSLAGAQTLSARLRIRQRDAATLQVEVSGRASTSPAAASWIADYADGGGVTFRDDQGAEETGHFPHTHRSWVPDADPALTGDPDTYWEAGSILHSEIHRDAATGEWTLFYTGAMSPGYGYRQIGLATSADGETWTKHAGNPVITIDYDTSTIDGIHAHMPSVVVDGVGTWHMYHSCYQNSVGNRICHATSADGRAWTRPPYGEGRVALDLGESGSFDDASLREPEVVIADDGAFQMFYVGTQASEHYGPAGLARSTDGGHTWERVAQVTTAESELQGGSVLQSAYGLEHWYQCGPNICFAASQPDADTGALDWTAWTLYGDDPVLRPGWASWNRSYIQAPTVTVGPDGRTLHMWFNANDYDVNVEVLGHARSTPRPDVWSTLDLAWDGTELSVSWEGGPPHTARLDSLTALTLSSTGAAELDEARLEWTPAATTDTGDDGAGDGGDGGGAGGDTDAGTADAGTSDSGTADAPVNDPSGGGCAGCSGGAASSGGTTRAAGPAALLLGLLGLARRRR